jgi:hypothetical protein
LHGSLRGIRWQFKTNEFENALLYSGEFSRQLFGEVSFDFICTWNLEIET